jgi:biotin carboxylase
MLGRSPHPIGGDYTASGGVGVLNLHVSSKRLLLLIPTTTYRTEDFVEAARKLDADLVIASDRPNVMSGEFPDHLLTLPFSDPEASAGEIRRFAARHPLDAVVPVDDLTTVVAAAISRDLGLRSSPVGAVSATRNKLRMRELLARSDVPSPAFASFSVRDDPGIAAARVGYPCVLKPLVLSASRGVIRAGSPDEFVMAFKRIAAILASPDVSALGEGADGILVEEFIPGTEVALEGLLIAGELNTLALFDKPDPLDGPFFEETIYVTPSRLPAAAQAAVQRTTAQAAQALGLTEGPVHAELRVRPDEAGLDTAWMIEIAARSIGGLCSRTLSFGTGMSLEEIILRHALSLPISSLTRDHRAAGVMMIPIPKGGLLEEVEGLDEARAVPLIEDVTISMHKGQEVVPLPEGSRYLGFIFSRADTPARAEAALRQAHSRLRFVIR